ncbi:MAG: hypothetical protein M3Y72_22690, partial [Acidobacteriota bacterium]|nr:hypothetical protein [Acidobacteriota bacterium]
VSGQIVQRLSVRRGDRWEQVPGSSSDESYRVIYRPLSERPEFVSNGGQFPTWNTDDAPDVTLSAGEGKLHSHMGPSTAPWLAGQLLALRPIKAIRKDDLTVNLEFGATPLGKLTASWKLQKSASFAQVQVNFEPSKPGYVSLGYHGAVSDTLQETDFVLLPYLFLGHRFPQSPSVVLNPLAPTPISLVERGGVSYALAASADDIPQQWPGPAASRYGLGLRNEDGLVQPLLYEPILGTPESVVEAAGGLVTANFEVFAAPVKWTALYKQVAQEAFRLEDYRTPVDGSLSDTASNLIDLLKNESASGWDAHAKGPWNIESRNTVTQASPLTYMSLYLLTGDQDLYRRFALPSMEFLLSRPRFHFAALPGSGDLWKASQALGPLKQYGSTVYASAFAMTRGGAPAFGALAKTASGNAVATAGEHRAVFEDELQLYRVTGESQWLELAIQGGDKYIAGHLTHLPENNPGEEPFVNVTFTPDWEGLLELYETTKLPRFLEASRTAAYWLVATLWTQPAPSTETREYSPRDGDPLIWWKGDRRFRLGMIDEPATLADPRPHRPRRYPIERVPAWEVSNVGLGLEQPRTYAQVPTNWNILMSVWAPKLLRLYQYTGDDLFLTAARNSTIGRFANYPGYYVNMYNVLYQSADFPYRGPDVSTIYYHHIPAFTAYVVDYLFSDVQMRSKGAIHFPTMRQDGYVWFDNDLPGYAPGTVYGHLAWPWLHKSAAAVKNQNVDKVLAHNDKETFVILLNQTHEAQQTAVSFDGKVLGTEVEGKSVRLWVDNEPRNREQIRGGSLSVSIPPFGIVVMALDGTHVNVPTQTGSPLLRRALPSEVASTEQMIPKSKYKAVGTFLSAPPFDSKELYVYVAAPASGCNAARLSYTIDHEPERHAGVSRFPCEFSVAIPDTRSSVEWHVDNVRGALGKL